MIRSSEDDPNKRERLLHWNTPYRTANRMSEERNVPANLRWLANQTTARGRTPDGLEVTKLLRCAAEGIETLGELVSEAGAKLATAEEERDALLAALGWKPGPFRDALSRKVILEDSAGLRPEMVKARQARQEAEGDRDIWRMILGEEIHRSRSGLLSRLWEALKTERRRRKEAEALIHNLRLPYAPAVGGGE